MQNCRRGRNDPCWCYSRHRSHLGSRPCRSNAQVDPKANGATASRKGCRRSAEPNGVVSRRDVVRCLSCLHPKVPEQLCVQERLMCPAGASPAGVRIGSPVAGRAGRRETNGPEAPRQPHLEGEGELSGRNDSEREVAPSVRIPGGRARNREGEGCTACRSPIDTAGRSGGVVSDGTTTRIRRATGETLLVPTGNGGSWVGRITGNTGKSADDERVADGLVVASRRGNARGAKGPCCS
jgi:hypothetical protein